MKVLTNFTIPEANEFYTEKGKEQTVKLSQTNIKNILDSEVPR
jgi:hypothetical protein